MKVLSNEEITQMLIKSGITTASGGIMPEEVKNTFIDTTVELSSFLKTITVEKDIKKKRSLHTLGVGTRMMKKRIEGTDLTDPRGATIGQRFLEPQSIALLYDISYDWIRKNIAGDKGEEQLNRAFAVQFSNDLVDLAFNGNTDVDGGDPDAAFLEIADGFVKRVSEDVDAHLFDREGSTDWKGTVFPGLLRALPEKYRQDITQLTYFVSGQTELEYREQLGERITVLGDSFTIGNPKPLYSGIPIEAVPNVPYGFIKLTRRKNMAVGFGDEFKLFRRFEERKAGGVVQYTIYADVDFNYAVSDLNAYTEAE